MVITMTSQESLRLLASELSNPRYGSYHLNFTNLLSKVGYNSLNFHVIDHTRPQ